MFTLKRQSVGRLQIIGYWILYLFALLVLIGMFQSEGDSSSSLLGFFLGMTIQILLCISIISQFKLLTNGDTK